MDVSSVICDTLDVYAGTSVNTETVGWTVKFYHTYDGVPVLSDDNEGIVVSLTKDGLRSLEYNWSTIVPQQKQQDTLKTEDQAKELYLNEMAKDDMESVKHIDYQQVYFYQSGQTVPFYVFGDNGPFMNPIYINAVTGEILEV